MENTKKRGRPKGSTSIKLNTSNLVNIELQKQIKNAPIESYNAVYNIQTWGSDNLYPYKLIDLYNTSVTHRSCIDFAVNAIVGQGIDWDAVQLPNEEMMTPNYQMSYDEFIRALAFDYSLYSGFAFQIIRSKDGQSYTFYPQPMETIRLEIMDEEGVINNAYICKDWSQASLNPPIKMPLFGFQEEEEIEIGVPYLFYYKKYNPVSQYYSLPIYSSCINAIQAEAQYQTWELKNVLNNFTPSGMLTVPTVDSEEQKKAIIKNINSMFSGAENASALMIQFSDNSDANKVQFTPFQASSTNVNLFGDANERTVSRIVAGHRIPSKALIGYSLDNLGFSNSSEYLQSAFSLYNINVANANRKEIMSVINNLFKLNGVDVELQLKPLNYNLESTETSSNAKANGETRNEEEAIERENNTI
ncbi:MAG: phage portal protein [Methanobrevibacter sp.]|nr:phage portal protein [Methanobrevibacter sp.]